MVAAIGFLWWSWYGNFCVAGVKCAVYDVRDYSLWQRFSLGCMCGGEVVFLACRRHMRGCIVSLGGMVWTHNTSLAPPLIFEVHVPSQERNGRVFVCKAYRFCLFVRYWIGFWKYSDSVVFSWFSFYCFIKFRI